MRLFCRAFGDERHSCIYRENDLFKGLSFPTISATGPNGGMFVFYPLACPFTELSTAHIAIIHYQPEHDDCAVIKQDQVCLISIVPGLATDSSLDLPLRFRR